MFRIVFLAFGGEEQEVFIAAESEAAAIKRVMAARDDFDLILTCTQLDTLRDWAVRLGLGRMAS